MRRLQIPVLLGKRQGEITTLVNLVKDGLLNITEAARRSNMDVAEFKKYL